MKKEAVFTIAKKEFADYFTSPMAYIILTVLWLVTGWFFTSSIFLIGEATLAGVTSNLDLLLVFIVPAIAMRLISDEKRAGTIENLLTSPIEAKEVVVGKYLGSLAVILIALLGMAVYPVSLSFIGRMDWGQALGMFAGYFMLAGMYLAAGLFASSLTEQNVSAYLISFVICFTFFMIGKALPVMPDFLQGALSFIAVDTHLDNTAKGVIDIRDIMYFASFTGLFLVLSEWRISAFKKNRNTASFILLGILIVANYFASYYFLRIDMTSVKSYSLSKASKKTARAFDERVVIKAYFNNDLPAQYLNIKNYLADLLQEYKSYNRSKIIFEFKNPSGNPGVMKEAGSEGLFPIQFTRIAADKYEVSDGYMGLVIYYAKGDRKEVIPYVKDTSGLEYVLTSAFKKLQDPSRKKIALIKAFGSSDLSGNPELEALVREHYDMEELLPGSSADAFSAALLISPSDAPAKGEMEWFHSISKKVPAGIFIDRLDVPSDTFYGIRKKCDIAALLAPYGLKIYDGTVLDAQNQRIGVQQQRGRFIISNIVNYPPFVAVTNFSPATISAKMERAVLPYVSAFEVDKSSSSGTEAFAFSSKKSWLDTITVFNPLQKFIKPIDAPEGPFALGVAVVKEPLRMAVLGTSRFIDSSVAEDPSNASFFLNIIDWLVQETDLIEIRNKGVLFRPLKKISDPARIAFKYVNIFLSPLLLFAAGMIVWKRSALKRERFKRIYEP
ncbi:MAG: Gldg family protein [Candidatus Omnitrophota bacterium]|nr:ABC transporter permease subunit [Candidatus Omnitrophota bacterium]MBU2528056.1 Gldg family protein [bacterium]MBU3929743.1 Gldg family protein [bacterium]MBU4122396.1 Gldg family protein [bacterium]